MPDLAEEIRRLAQEATQGDWIADCRLGVVAVYAGEPRTCLSGIGDEAVLVQYGRGEVAPLVRYPSVTPEQEATAKLVALLHNNIPAILEALEDTKRLEWLIRELNDPARDPAAIGAWLGRIVAGGIVGEDIYPDPRAAIDAARKERS